MLAVLVAAVFGATIGFRFLGWDDNTNITENPYLAAGSPTELVRFWTAPYAGLYVPVTYTWWWAELVVSKDFGEGAAADPHVYHAGNVILHLGCAWLVFLLLRRLLANDVGALAGAALWAVHPVQVEVVSWVTASKDLLAAFFTLGALLLHLRFRDEGGGRLRGAAIAAFCLALLAKPSAVAAPGLALLIDVLWLRRPLGDSARALIPWGVAALAVIAMTKAQQPNSSLRYALPWLERPVIALDALAFYLAKIVAPLRLLPDYGRTPTFLHDSGAAAWTWIVPVAVAAAVLRFRRDRRWTVPAAWFAVALAPVLGLIPFEFQNISTVADRYLYVALLGPALAVGAIVASRKGRAAVAVAAALVVTLGAAAHVQAGRWRDTETLFEYTLAHQPASFTAHNNLGVELAARGRYDEALAHLDEVIRLAPGYYRAWANRGSVREKLGRHEEALADLQEALRIQPDYPKARLALAQVLKSLGREKEAEQQLALAFQGDESSPEAHNRRGVEAYAAGDLPTAERELTEAIRLRPGYAEAENNLANVLVREGRPQDALPHYEAALRIDPDYYNAHLNLGKVLMRSTDQEGAIRHLERALELGGPNPELARRIQELKARAGGFAPWDEAAAADTSASAPGSGDQSR